MASNRKSFDAVASMRRTRDKLSRRFKGMTFAEQKREMELLLNHGSDSKAKPKRRTA